MKRSNLGPFDWGSDRAPRTPWTDTVVYECHVKGMTQRHPDVEEALRGTYLGLAAPPVIEHLQALGVTAVELLPVQHAEDEARLAPLGLTNYWGYNPRGWFTSDPRFATAPGRQFDEFRAMVRALHAAGIEVLLDVVFNHTAEGALPESCYRHDERGERVDWTGCGNTVDFGNPEVCERVRDCLRWWVRDLHVDGFRFDLAVTMGRGGDFLETLVGDPELAGIKLIAEPWDLGPDGYRLGRFPAGWSEWNDRYRQAVRRFWTGASGSAPELARRIGGSDDLLTSPSASINYVCCHDGFTLHDLVRYDAKQNAANREGGRDGSNDNQCRDFGPSADVVERSMIATLALSRGVPMIGGGDELGRTQRGNNNAYCHDSELTWVDWAGADLALLEFVKRAFALRRRFPVLRADAAYAPHEARWYDLRGCELHSDGWREPGLTTFAVRLGDRLMVLLNACAEPVSFALPQGPWTVELDAAGGTRPGEVAGRALQLLSR